MSDRRVPGRFRVAFSFAGAQRDLVRDVANELEGAIGHGSVFLDEWFEHYIAGDDADLKLQEIYMNRSDLVVVCVSSAYNDRPWTKIEHRAIRALMMRSPGSSLGVLPLRVGDGDVDGILDNAIVPDARERPPTAVSSLIVNRLRELSRSNSGGSAPTAPIPPQLKEAQSRPAAAPFKLAATITSSVVRRLRGLPPAKTLTSQESRARAFELLAFAASERVALMPNWQNVVVNQREGTPTPSWATAQAVTDVAVVLGSRNVEVSEVAEPWAYEPGAEHLVAFGFETSQPFYRRIAGWREFDPTIRPSEFNGYERYDQVGPFDLPWKSNLGTEADQNDPNEYYYSANGENKIKTKRRIWSLHSGGTVLRPRFDSDSNCIVDYISIVHIPNYLASSNFTMTFAGGIQAAGTKAIAQLLADKIVMETIARKAPSLSSWQAVVRASFSAPRFPPVFFVQDVAPVSVDHQLLTSWRWSPPTF